MKTELVPIGSSYIEALRSGDRGWVVVKQVCDQLGISGRAQRKRLEQTPWAVGSVTVLPATATDGKVYDTFCLDISKAAMWLATIDTARVKDHAAKARLVDFQGGASAALDRWFRGPAAPARLSGGDDPLELAEMLLQSIKAQRQELRKLSDQQGALAATQASQAADLRELKAGQAAARLVLDEPLPIAPELPGISLRTKINGIVRAGAAAAGMDIQAAWRYCYRKLREHYHIDVAARAEHRRMTKLDVVEADGHMDKLLAIVERYFVQPHRQVAGNA